MADETVLEYKCPCCGAGLKFDGGAQELVCEYCDNKFSVEQLEQLAEAERDEKNTSEPEWSDYTGTETEGEQTAFICQSCGAALVGDDTMMATECPYCGNPAIIKERVSGALRPDYIIPFRLDRQAAKDTLKKFYKGKLLLPRAFKSENCIDKLQGVYVPFWLFDCNADGTVHFNATRVSTWRSGDYRYTKTSHFLVIRGGHMAFEKIPVDASEKMDDSYMDSLEPFDYRDLTDFGTAYLSGFLADRFDVSAKDSAPRASRRVKQSLEDSLRSTVHGYASVTTRSTDIHTSDSQVKYAMLPVYILNTKYKGKPYFFAMNGQTGKFVGKLPISWGRFFAWAGGIAAAAVAIGQLFLLIGGMFG